MHRLKKLPYKKTYNTVDIYKYLSDANFSLGELKGVLDNSRYTNIVLHLINQAEAKASCEIANIKTTYDTLFKDRIISMKHDENAQHIKNYMRAIHILFRDATLSNKITLDSINSIHTLVDPSSPGLRKLRGLKVYHKNTNEVVHIPPQNQNAINEYYQNLEDYINNNLDHYDPLIKMAIIHYQFECIRPYLDGNGRTGRILNIMYLVNAKRLNYPILNLSKHFLETKETYYDVLTKSHNDIQYLDEFIIYMLKGINDTTKYTVNFINQITRIINITKKEMKNKIPKIYSDQLVTHLFKFIYTKNELFRNALNLSRTTATKYLKKLVEHGYLEEEKIGKETIYKNTQVDNIFSDNY